MKREVRTFEITEINVYKYQIFLSFCFVALFCFPFLRKVYSELCLFNLVNSKISSFFVCLSLGVGVGGS